MAPNNSLSLFHYNYGGRVQTHPRVYLVFWGSKWVGDTSGVVAAEKALFGNLYETSYNGILAQYTDSFGDYVHDDVTLAGSWVDGGDPTRTNIGAGDIAAEAAHAASQNGWSDDADTQFLVFPQQGTGYASSLAFRGVRFTRLCERERADIHLGMDALRVGPPVLLRLQLRRNFDEGDDHHGDA